MMGFNVSVRVKKKQNRRVDFKDRQSQAKKGMDERQGARGNDTDSGSKAGDKRADGNGCSP